MSSKRLFFPFLKFSPSSVWLSPKFPLLPAFLPEVSSYNMWSILIVLPLFFICCGTFSSLFLPALEMLFLTVLSVAFYFSSVSRFLGHYCGWGSHMEYFPHRYPGTGFKFLLLLILLPFVNILCVRWESRKVFTHMFPLFMWFLFKIILRSWEPWWREQ